MSEYRARRGLLSRMPVWLKACLVKAWFGGAVFFFVGWGLFIQSSDQLDLAVALGLALGLATDLMVNRVLVFSESGRLEYRPFLFCYSRRFLSLPVNLLYGVLLSFCVAYTYHFINLAAIAFGWRQDGFVFIGGEPILYGLFFTGWDMLFIFVKRVLVRIFKKGV